MHSHVDDVERRKWNQGAPFACACGGQGKGECDPTHPHHKGNELADAAAALDWLEKENFDYLEELIRNANKIRGILDK